MEKRLTNYKITYKMYIINVTLKSIKLKTTYFQKILILIISMETIEFNLTVFGSMTIKTN